METEAAAEAPVAMVAAHPLAPMRQALLARRAVTAQMEQAAALVEALPPVEPQALAVRVQAGEAQVGVIRKALPLAAPVVWIQLLTEVTEHLAAAVAEEAPARAGQETVGPVGLMAAEAVGAVIRRSGQTEPVVMAAKA